MIQSLPSWRIDRSVHFETEMNGLYQPYHLPKLEQCMRAHQMQDFGICPSRLWNLLLSNRNQHINLIAIISGLNRTDFPRSSTTHSSCTEQLCMFADDNSTNTTQLHKFLGVSGGPPSSKCRQTIFSLDDLRKLLSKNPGNPWVCSAWNIRKWEKYSTGKSTPSNSLLSKQPLSRYVAISHVWSDGTGVGIESPEIVNSCLAAYSARIAIRLNSDGLWWDSICVPSGREEKRRAMDRMLNNFANATYTVIHDISLLDFEWKDDGTPIIAVTLSPWFTRGWTAAELFSACHGKGCIKVLFKDPNPKNTEPLIKDVHSEILAPSEKHSGLRSGRLPSHAHLSASRIVRSILESETDAEVISLPHLTS